MKQWSLRYAIFRNALVFAFHKFYQEVEIIGLENIPDGDPVIFAENHTNAVLDPVLTAIFHNRQPGFLTRSDVFTNTILNKIFRGFKMIPVYRQRDGVNSQVANNPIFNAVVNHLKEGGSIVIAPEGDKGVDHHLLPLKKGGSRIAVQFMEEMYWKKPLYVVPVGITYGSYMSHRSDLLVHYGKPFLVNDFKEAHEQNPEKIFRIITERLAQEIKALTWDVEDENDLPLFYRFKKLDGAAEILAERMNWASKKLEAAKNLPADERNKLITILDRYLESLEKKGFTDNDVKEADSANKLDAMAMSIILSPFALINMLMHFIPLQLSYFLVNKMKLHPHFQTSILFGFCFLLFPVFYLTYFIIILALTKSLVLSIFILLIGPVIATISQEWHRKWRSLIIPRHLIQKRKMVMERMGNM